MVRVGLITSFYCKELEVFSVSLGLGSTKSYDDSKDNLGFFGRMEEVSLGLGSTKSD